MSDRIAVMSGGKILQIASPRELYEAPNCREVADFIGEMNFFDGMVTSRDSGVAVVDSGPFGTLRLAASGAVGARLLLALRPEKIALAADGAPGAVKGTVMAAAFLGERSHYNIQVAGRDEPVSVAAQNAEKIVTRGHAPGDTVFLSWTADAVVVLPG